MGTADVCWIDPPLKKLTSDQIAISYVKLFFNNKKKKKLQMYGLVRKPIFWGGQSNTHRQYSVSVRRVGRTHCLLEPMR